MNKLCEITKIFGQTVHAQCWGVTRDGSEIQSAVLPQFEFSSNFKLNIKLEPNPNCGGMADQISELS
jgi:hypothetical protein